MNTPQSSLTEKMAEHDLSNALPGAEVPEPLKAEDEQFVCKLGAIWQTHDESSLPLRHELGLLVSEKMTELRKDQGRRQAILKRGAERLGMSTSDVSRLQAFASEFPTFEGFQEKHPDVKTWSGVKRLLAQLHQVQKGQSKEPRTTEKQRQAAVDELKSIRVFLARVKDELNIRQATEVERITEEILQEIGDLLTPLQKAPRSQPSQA